MKHISYSFSNSDIEAITFALTVLPSLGIEETEAQAAINYQCCCSAGEKLLKIPTQHLMNFALSWLPFKPSSLSTRANLKQTRKQSRNAAATYLLSISLCLSLISKCHSLRLLQFHFQNYYLQAAEVFRRLLFCLAAFSHAPSRLVLPCRRFFSLKKLLKNLLSFHTLYSWRNRCYFFTVCSISYQLASSAARQPPLPLMRRVGFEPTTYRL